MADLRVRLKNKNTIASLSDDSGIDLAYLSLLRRVLEGFFPKPRPLKAFDWLDQDVTAKLARAGVKNTQQLYEAVLAGADELAKRVGLKKKALSEFQAVSDLSRIQWVSPTYVRVLVAAGFARVARVAAADPERLYEAVVVANEDGRFYKGKVGLRDIKRLVVAAGYVPLSTMNESMA